MVMVLLLLLVMVLMGRVVRRLLLGLATGACSLVSVMASTVGRMMVRLLLLGHVVLVVVLLIAAAVHRR